VQNAAAAAAAGIVRTTSAAPRNNQILHLPPTQDVKLVIYCKRMHPVLNAVDNNIVFISARSKHTQENAYWNPSFKTGFIRFNISFRVIVTNHSRNRIRRLLGRCATREC
jgi:hypothetical protein